jgi:hypothetical protein
VELERQRRGDPEVPAAASDRPVEIGVDVGRGRAQLAVGADELGREDVVARQAVLAAGPSFAAAQGEPGYAGVGHDASGSHETEGLGLAVHVPPQRSALDTGDARLGIDVDAAHLGKVDEHAAVDAREAGHGVPATADGDQQVVFPGEVHGVDDVGRAGGDHDDRRAPGMHGVVGGSNVGVAGVIRGEHLTPQCHAECRQVVVGDRGRSAGQCRYRGRHRPPPFMG